MNVSIDGLFDVGMWEDVNCSNLFEFFCCCKVLIGLKLSRNFSEGGKENGRSVVFNFALHFLEK